MIVLENKGQCCGCRACEQACSVHCIEMLRDAEGFWYPHVNEDKCIECNACEKVCPCLNQEKINSKSVEQDVETISAFGCRNNNEEIREKSSSGGCFSAFAEKIIRLGGIVFACVLEEKRAVVVSTDSVQGLDAMRGSKYVQCDTKQSYSEIKSILATGRVVLFVGTPCQVAGLYAFLGYKEYENLFTMDFICHGVPSPKLLEDYLANIEKKAGSTIALFKFRNKDRGWSQTGLQLGTYYELQDGTKQRNYPAFRDKYMNAFLDDVALRPSCYECDFKSIPKSYADFTVADFWGVDNVAPALNDKKGTSLLIVYSKKGKRLWNEISDSFTFESVNLDKAISRNHPLVESAKRYDRRDNFFEDYNKKGYEFVEKKYMSALKWGTHKAFAIIKKIWKKFEQFIKFGIVGCSNTLINLAVYYFFLSLGMHYIFAYTLGFLVSVCNAFYWNNKYVFKNKQEKSIVKAFLKVFASYGFSFLLSLVLMSLMVEIMRVSSLIAPILKLVITIPLNFVLNKIWAFKDRKDKNEVSE